MSCRCAIKFLNLYFHPWSHIRGENEVSFPYLITWTSVSRGIVNKLYAKMWLGRPCRCPMRFKKLHFAPGVKLVFFKEYIFFNLTQFYIPLLLLPPLERRCDPSFQHIWVPLHKDTLCQVWLKLAKWFLRIRFFLKSQMHFLYVAIIYYLPLK